VFNRCVEAFLQKLIPQDYPSALDPLLDEFMELGIEAWVLRGEGKEAVLR
jgi:hypothetical protein